MLADQPFDQMQAVLRSAKEATKSAFKTKKFDITIDQWTVLNCIANAEHANQSYLATHTHKDPAAITRMIELLVNRGLVQRKEEKTDRRAYHVKLTRKGAGLVKRVGPVVEKINQAAMQEVSSRDLSAMRRITGKMIEGLGA